MTPAPTPIENLWDVKQVMTFLNVKRTWVYEAANRGELPHVRLGSKLRFEPDQVREYVRKNRSTVQVATVLPIAGGRR